jgi:hypothetical protein
VELIGPNNNTFDKKLQSETRTKEEEKEMIQKPTTRRQMGRGGMIERKIVLHK